MHRNVERVQDTQLRGAQKAPNYRTSSQHKLIRGAQSAQSAQEYRTSSGHSYVVHKLNRNYRTSLEHTLTWCTKCSKCTGLQLEQKRLPYSSCQVGRRPGGGKQVRLGLTPLQAHTNLHRLACCTYTWIHAWIPTHSHTHTHTQAHTHKHTYIYTQGRARLIADNVTNYHTHHATWDELLPTYGVSCISRSAERACRPPLLNLEPTVIHTWQGAWLCWRIHFRGLFGGACARALPLQCSWLYWAGGNSVQVCVIFCACVRHACGCVLACRYMRKEGRIGCLAVVPGNVLSLCTTSMQNHIRWKSTGNASK